MKQINTILSPPLFEFFKLKEDTVAVVVDILRSTTTITKAVNAGARIIPVATIEETLMAKNQGFLVAGDGNNGRMAFKDFGNSGRQIQEAGVNGKDIYLFSLNGVKVIKMMQNSPVNEIIIASFCNITAVENYLASLDKNILLLCSGWRNAFCLEDAVFCGALAKRLTSKGFDTEDDSTLAAMDLWAMAEGDLKGYMQKTEHLNLLQSMKMEPSFDYAFEMDSCKKVAKVHNEEKTIIY